MTDRGICITFHNEDSDSKVTLRDWIDPIEEDDVSIEDGHLVVDAHHEHRFPVTAVKSYRFYDVGVDDYNYGTDEVEVT